MLEFMRKRTRSTWIKVTFLIIILVFVFWGVGGSMSGSRSDVIADINGQTISTREFQRAYENLKNAYREVYKERLTAEVLEQMNLREQALDQLVEIRLLEAEATRVGFTVSDGEVRQEIAKAEAFQEHGSFSQERYLRVLRYLRLSPSEFEEEQRTQLLIKKLQSLITDATQVTDDEVRELFEFSQKKVALSFVKISSADLVGAVTVDAQETEDYYSSHLESFRQPERVKFAYVAYPAKQFEAGVDVSTKEVEDFYNEHKEDRFTTPPRVHARHILFALGANATEEEKAKTRTAAAEVLEKARAGEDFVKLAETYSQDKATAAQGGDLGSFARGRMVKPFEEAAFALPAGGISDLVESQFGLHIIKVETNEPENIKPMNEVEEEIRQELRHERANAQAEARARADREKIQNGTPLAEVAQASGVSVVETPLVAREETIPDLGSQPQLVEAALGLAPRQTSEPIEVNDSWYLVSLREKIASTIPEFSVVKEEAEKKLKGEKAEQRAKEKAETLLAKIKETKDLAAVAAEQKLTVEETGVFTRQGSYIPKMGSLPELKKMVFQLTPESPVAPQISMWSGNAFIVVLKEKLAPAPEEFEKQKDAMKEQLQKRKQADALAEFMRLLKKRATITYNQEALLKFS
ncbi:MAG: SurA N-terminal domain-containing protein [Candidatus Binatia bacterium]